MLGVSLPTFGAEDDEQIQQKLEALEQRIRELEAERETEAVPPAAPPPVSAAPAEEGAAPAPVSAAPAEKGAVPPSPAEKAEAEIREGRRAPVIYRKSMNERQYAAVRAGDYTLDPDYRGFLQVPNTAVMIKFNARPRVDLIGDTQNAGTDFRFVPALFPQNSSHGWRVDANANGSQLLVDVRAPAVDGTPRFYYQNDFFGSNQSNMQYRLQHLYGEIYGVLAGFTYGVFEDPDAWPDTVDYEGPNSVVFARRALAQYMVEFAEGWELTLSVEDPDQYVDLNGESNGNRQSRAPDTGFALRWASADWGHLRFASIFRSVGSSGDNFGNEDVFGWGVNASGSLALWGEDNMQFWFVYGEGVGGMGNDTSFVNSDAAFNGNGKLRALEYYSTMIAYTRQWSPRWRSTATHGYVHLENTSGQAANAYNESHYASVNLMYQIFKRLQVGVEGLYGYKKVNDGRSVDLFRVQLGVSWKLFD